ncbi:7,8-dihydro-8-oxoguanine triphosphatase precursor [Cricetulus griseus]|nr:7,8-dihydro-8-oxoguanine triphosphatase precursor [Cricetulus griseus]
MKILWLLIEKGRACDKSPLQVHSEENPSGHQMKGQGPVDQKCTARFTNKETEASRGVSYARVWLELRVQKTWESMGTSRLYTLLMVLQTQQVFLGIRKIGFDAGHWDDFGVKVQEADTIEESAERHLQEESGLTVDDLHKVSNISFEFVGSSKLMDVHIFSTLHVHGMPTENEKCTLSGFKWTRSPLQTYGLMTATCSKKFCGYF